MPILLENPHELGPDRLVNAVAGYERCGDACVVVDFGTAINYDVVSSAGRVPGRDHRARASRSRSRRSPRAPPGSPRSTSSEPRSLIGKSTEAAIQSGIVYGFAAQVDGICARLRAELGGERHDDRHRRHGERDRRVHGEHRRGRRPADAEGPAARLRAKPLSRSGPLEPGLRGPSLYLPVPQGPCSAVSSGHAGLLTCDAERSRTHTAGLREAQGRDRAPAHRRSGARSPSASRRRASSATSARTPSTTTPRTSRRCSRRASRSSRTSCATRP